MSITIRALERKDRQQWDVLWDGYNAFYGRSGGTALDPAITELTWARFLDPTEPMHCLLACDQDRVVGLAHYLYHRSTTRAQQVCYLQDLFTLDSLRGQGIGRKLIEGVFGAAREAGSSRVYWQTRTDNRTARVLYDKMAVHDGFIVYVRELG